MKVYIEFFVAENVVVTALISGLAYRFLGMRPRKLRTALAAIAGTLASVFYPFWELPTPLMVLAKLLVGVALSVLLFTGVCNVPMGVLCFFASTALLAGATLAADCFIAGDLGLALSSPSRLPYGVPSAAALAVYFPARVIVSAVRKRRAESAFVCKAVVTVCGKTAELSGYIDTGNGLEENGMPVAVVKLSSFVREFGEEALLRSCGEKTVSGVGGAAARLILIIPDGFLLYFDKKRNKHSDVILGVSAGGFRRREDMLLPVSVLGG